MHFVLLSEAIDLINYGYMGRTSSRFVSLLAAVLI